VSDSAGSPDASERPEGTAAAAHDGDGVKAAADGDPTVGTDDTDDGGESVDTDDTDDTGESVDTDGTDDTGGQTVDLAATLEDGPVLFFDGVCNLCSGVVRFVIERDDDERIRFASLQSDAGRVVRERLGLPDGDLETVVLVEGSKAYTRSAAVIRVGELLGGVYGLAGVGWLVPERLRDRLYDAVAERRYDWFGRKDRCMVPTPERRSRFVE
jgi:predicted DCC family thiol-disulfide oxidoreductase YuxK